VNIIVPTHCDALCQAILPWFLRMPALAHFRDFQLPDDVPRLRRWAAANADRPSVKVLCSPYRARQSAEPPESLQHVLLCYRVSYMAQQVLDMHATTCLRLPARASGYTPCLTGDAVPSRGQAVCGGAHGALLLVCGGQGKVHQRKGLPRRLMSILGVP